MANFIGQWLHYSGPKPKRGRYARKNQLTYAHFKSWAFRQRKYRKGARIR